MIKQDNRPQSDFHDQRYDMLKTLLQSEPENETATREPPESEEPPKGRMFFISINGNNNVVSTGKSRNAITGKFGKRSLFAVVTVISLFF